MKKGYNYNLFITDRSIKMRKFKMTILINIQRSGISLDIFKKLSPTGAFPFPYI